MAETGVSAEETEKLLNGQSSQGIVTAKEVHELLTYVNKLEEFPLFEATYQIAFGSESRKFTKLVKYHCLKREVLT